jgi:Spy/CpxP family protein refolding chaperone
MTRSALAAVAAALLLAGPALGQQPGKAPTQPAKPGAMGGMSGMPGMGKAKAPAHAAPGKQGMQGMGGMGDCMAMMGGPSAAMILMHHQDLALTDGQVQRLRTLAARDSTTATPHMRAAMAAHASAAAILRAASPDFAAYEARLRDAANHAIEGHVAMARTAVEARNVLTAEQRTRLQALHARMMGQGMGTGAMGSGMMTGCPMMGGM